MATTAFIKPIQNNKGIFYTFKSAEGDIMSTFNHDQKKFRFSKFVLLNIPAMGVPNGMENKMQFLAPGETPMIEGIHSTDYNKNLAESFQNYCLNFESLLMSRNDFNNELRHTVGERVFWKWMKETGALRFIETEGGISDEEKDYSILGTEKRFTEEKELPIGSPAVTVYNKVVQYVGEIDVVLSRKGTNAYSMVYVYIPTNVGNTPYVMFKSMDDDNYTENMTILNSKADYEDIEYLSGRKYNDVHPFNLSTLAFYDLDDGSIDSYISDGSGIPSYNTGYWFTGTNNNAYYTDELFNIADNSWIQKI